MSESFIAALDIAFYACAAASIVSLLILIVNFVRARQSVPPLADPGFFFASRFPIKSTASFVALVGMLAALVTIIGTHARNDALDFLSSLPASRIVIVNGRRIETPDPILDALKTMRLVQAHHSHPAHTIDVEIVAGARILRLRLGRDSQDPNEYWVYDPKYRVTNSNEIGHVFTDTLARY